MAEFTVGNYTYVSPGTVTPGSGSTVTPAADVDVGSLGFSDFNEVSPDQAMQNRTAMLLHALENSYQNHHDNWTYTLTAPELQRWEDANIWNNMRNEGGPGNSDIESAIRAGFRRGMFDQDMLADAMEARGLTPGAGGPDLGGGTNQVNAPDFTGMSAADAWSAAVNGHTDPQTGTFMGGFRQLSEVPFGSLGWAGTLANALGMNAGFGGPAGGIGDPGFGAGMENGMGAGNPGR